jgi:hypothetical protein
VDHVLPEHGVRVQQQVLRHVAVEARWACWLRATGRRLPWGPRVLHSLLLLLLGLLQL